MITLPIPCMAGFTDAQSRRCGFYGLCPHVANPAQGNLPTIPIQISGAIQEKRQAVLNAACAANPRRFTRRPRAPALPGTAWINKPVTVELGAMRPGISADWLALHRHLGLWGPGFLACGRPHAPTSHFTPNPQPRAPTRRPPPPTRL